MALHHAHHRHAALSHHARTHHSGAHLPHHPARTHALLRGCGGWALRMMSIFGRQSWAGGERENQRECRGGFVSDHGKSLSVATTVNASTRGALIQIKYRSRHFVTMDSSQNLLR